MYGWECQFTIFHLLDSNWKTLFLSQSLQERSSFFSTKKHVKPFHYPLQWFLNWIIEIWPTRFLLVFSPWTVQTFIKALGTLRFKSETWVSALLQWFTFYNLRSRICGQPVSIFPQSDISNSSISFYPIFCWIKAIRWLVIFDGLKINIK